MTLSMNTAPGTSRPGDGADGYAYPNQRRPTLSTGAEPFPLMSLRRHCSRTIFRADR